MAGEDDLNFFNSFLAEVSDEPMYEGILSILEERDELVHAGEIVDILEGQMGQDQIVQLLLSLFDKDMVHTDGSALFGITPKGVDALERLRSA